MMANGLRSLAGLPSLLAMPARRRLPSTPPSTTDAPDLTAVRTKIKAKDYRAPSPISTA